MKSLLPVIALLLLLTGCSTFQKGAGQGPVAHVATIEEHIPNQDEAPANKEIRCQIQMIDGVMMAASDALRPGHHRLIVALGSQENEFSGDVDLIIPRAKNYRLKAERDDDLFTLSLIEADSSKMIAASTATAEQVMKFEVFVLQK